MKFFILLSFFILNKAMALDVCSFKETWMFNDAMRVQKVKPNLVAKDHKKFNSMEKKLVHKTVALQAFSGEKTLLQSVDDFADIMYDGTRGANAGKISYFNIEGKQLILVHYWPGENEYGAFFSINRNGSLKLLARISDGFIDCK